MSAVLHSVFLTLERSAEMSSKRAEDKRFNTNLTNESEQYLAKREELRLAELESMRLRERVAELRRQLSLCSIEMVTDGSVTSTLPIHRCLGTSWNGALIC